MVQTQDTQSDCAKIAPAPEVPLALAATRLDLDAGRA
jgi:hypothetical protein